MQRWAFACMLLVSSSGCSAEISGSIGDFPYDGVEQSQLRLFLSTTEVPGDFAVGTSPITAADAICASDARNAGLVRTYRAIFSAPGNSIRDRLEVDGAVYVLTTSGAEKVADDLAHLFDATAKNLYRTVGVRLDGYFYTEFPMTGTTSNGGASASHCSNWTDAVVSTASIGHTTQLNGTWLGVGGLGSCLSSRPVYCISQ
jgi:hypothetical protein